MNTAQTKASELLNQSAVPFDAACLRVIALEEALAEAVAYLDSNQAAAIPAGSILHHIMKLALTGKQTHGTAANNASV